MKVEKTAKVLPLCSCLSVGVKLSFCLFVFLSFCSLDLQLVVSDIAVLELDFNTPTYIHPAIAWSNTQEFVNWEILCWYQQQSLERNWSFPCVNCTFITPTVNICQFKILDISLYVHYDTAAADEICIHILEWFSFCALSTVLVLGSNPFGKTQVCTTDTTADDQTTGCCVAPVSISSKPRRMAQATNQPQRN